jgi:hypothetical protein
MVMSLTFRCRQDLLITLPLVLGNEEKAAKRRMMFFVYVGSISFVTCVG